MGRVGNDFAMGNYATPNEKRMLNHKKYLPSTGSIIWLDLGESNNTEQQGYRPCLVLSRNKIIRNTGLAQICPISTSRKESKKPYWVKLDNRTKTVGHIMVEQIRTVDLINREFTEEEKLPDDILSEVIDKTLKLFPITIERVDEIYLLA